jgi:hypothetical protein
VDAAGSRQFGRHLTGYEPHVVTITAVDPDVTDDYTVGGVVAFGCMVSRNEGSAQVRLSGDDVDVPLARLGLRRPASVLVVSGTTADLEPKLAESLLPMLAGAVAVAAEHEVAVVTGGTDAGVFHLLGLALSSTALRPRVVVGVAPDGLVTSEGPSGPGPESVEGRVPVAPQLSVLVRVPGDSWGDETAALSAVVGRISGNSRVVVLLAGGGDVSRRELVEHLAAGRSVVVVAGTGRLADAVALRRAGPALNGGPGTPPSGDDLGALLANGDVHVVSLDDGPQGLRHVLRSLLVPPRRLRLRERFALLGGLPQWRFRPEPPDALLDPDAARRYPLLRQQIVDADRLIYPFFAECDMTAQIEQNRHRQFTVLAIGGGLLTTVFGALQAWLQTVAWPGVVVATLGAATSALITVARRQGSLLNYLTARVRAERLRSLYFEYLAGPPAIDEAIRNQGLRNLERQVVQVQSEPVAP